MNEARIKSFTDLKAWQRGHDLVVAIYKSTKEFPREESFALTSQMRRAVVSITSNIAEGFSRRSYKEKVKFYRMSQGSLTELQSQLLIAKDVGYISRGKFLQIAERTVEVHKIINGLIKKSESIQNS